MGIAVAQSKYNRIFSGTSDSDSFSSAVTAGGTVAVLIYGVNNSVGYDVTSVTDNQGNTYTLIKSAGSNNGKAVIAWATNVTASGTFTVTINHPTSSSVGYTIAEVSGAASSSFDVSAVGDLAGASSTDANATTATTAQANEIVLAVMGINGGNSPGWSITGPGGFTNMGLEQGSGFTAPPYSSDYKVVSSVGTQAVQYTHTDLDGSHSWSIVVATFKDATPGGGGGNTALDSDAAHLLIPMQPANVVTVWM